MQSIIILFIVVGSLVGILVVYKLFICCFTCIFFSWTFGLKEQFRGRRTESARPRRAGLALQVLPLIAEERPGTQSDIVSLSGVTVCGTEENQ